MENVSDGGRVVQEVAVEDMQTFDTDLMPEAPAAYPVEMTPI